MTSAVDGLKQRFMAMSQPDADGVYRNGAAKRKARTDLAMGNLTQLWNEACEAVSFDVPATGIGLGAVGSLARGQVGPSSDLDLVVIYEPHALTDQQLNELANKLWYPIWDSGLDLDQSVRTVAQCEAVTDRDLPAAMGWLDVVPIAGDSNPPAKRLRHQPFQRFHRHLASRLPTFCPHSAKKANHPSSPTTRPDHHRRDRRKRPMSWRRSCAPAAFARS